MDRPEERIALIEVFEPVERLSRAMRAVDVFRWPVSIGRALDNQIVLDDPHVAPHHALLQVDEQGRPTLVVLASQNGVRHAGRQLASGQSFTLPDAGADLQVGTTRVRLRLPAEALAPELAMPGPVSGWQAHPALVGVLVFALQIATHWISLDPGADLSAWLPALVGLPVALTLWCGIWALVSKLFQHRFDFSGHLRIALPWLLAMSVAEILWPQIAAAIDSPSLWFLGGAVQVLLAALLVHAHLVHALPAHPRAVGGVVAAFVLVGAAISLTLTHRQTDTFHGAPYMSTLPMPALRLAGTVPPDALIRAMPPMAAKLAERAEQARKEDDEAEAPEDDAD